LRVGVGCRIRCGRDCPRKLDMTLFKDVATLKNFMDKYLGVTPLSTEEVK
jgi:hypothetical protein